MVFVPVTRRCALVPVTLRSRASASIWGALVWISRCCIAHRSPQPVRHVWRSHACTVSSNSELEKYCICIVSILVLLAFKAGVDWALRTICAHAVFTSSPMFGQSSRVGCGDLVVRQPEHVSTAASSSPRVRVEVHGAGVDRQSIVRVTKMPRLIQTRPCRSNFAAARTRITALDADEWEKLRAHWRERQIAESNRSAIR